MDGTAPDEHVGWTSIPNLRSTLDILWTCLFTVFLCCWTAIHPNVPLPGSSWMYQFCDRTSCFLVGLVAPEFLTYVAYIEREAAINDNAELPPGCEEKRWSRTHRFYASMGGFFLPCNGSEVDNKPRYLSANEMYQLLRKGTIPWTSIPTVQDILDKGKADGIVKAFTILQIFSVLLQTILRVAQHLPLTTLELGTLAYIPCSCYLFYLWWDKPYDVQIPTIIDLSSPQTSPIASKAAESNIFPAQSHIRGTDYITYNMFHECRHALSTVTISSYQSMLLSSTGFAVVGAIHLTAWNYTFPSRFELWAWRISSLTITLIIPITWLVSRYLFDRSTSLISRKFAARRWSRLESKYDTLWDTSARVVRGFGYVLYAVARLYLIVEGFVSLRSVPKGVYETPDWTNFLPHIS